MTDDLFMRLAFVLGAARECFERSAEQPGNEHADRARVLSQECGALLPLLQRAAAVLDSALVVGHWWLAQDGIGATELDALGKAVAAYLGEDCNGEPEEPEERSE